jgi:hypothetical protein
MGYFKKKIASYMVDPGLISVFFEHDLAMAMQNFHPFIFPLPQCILSVVPHLR